MAQEKINKYLEWALKGVLYLVLLTPLLLSSKYLFPFITTKTMYFRLVVELAIILYVALAMLAPKFKPRMTKLSWAIVIFGIIIFITGITGVDFYKTFWGTIERGEGFLTISHLMIYFLILSWTLKSKKEWLNYISGLAIAGFLVDIYALLQQANVEHIFLIGRIIPSENRLSATIGNAAFLGAFCLAQFFLSLLLLFKRKHIAWKIFFALAALLNFLIMFQTQTRGALIAWSIVMVGLSFLYAIKCPNKFKKKIGLGIFIAVIVVTSIFWLNKNNDLIQKNNTLRRIANISLSGITKPAELCASDTIDITMQSRLCAWDTSWKGWQDRFVLGYGWENYNIAFNKYFHAEIFKDQGSQLWFDRAHNTIFDVAVATGIFGLISYITIFGLALYYLFKNLKRDFDLSAVLIALLIAHFLQNIFVFDVLASYIILFTVWAFIVFIALKNQSLTSEPNTFQPSNFNVLIILPVLLITVWAAYVFNIKPLQANLKTVNGLLAASANYEKESVAYFISAIEMNTYQTPEIRQKLGDNVILYNSTKNNLSDTEVYQNFQVAIKAMKDNIQEHPGDVQNYLYLMAVLNKAGSYNSTYYDEIIEWGEKALVLSPTRPQTYFEMGQARISQKRYEQGIDYFKKAIDLNPETLESHWNLMTAYILAGQDENGEKEYEFMLSRGYDFDQPPRNLNRLYNIYLLANKKDKLVEILERLVVVEPTSQNYARLAAACKEIGEIEKAKQAVFKAVELDPSLAEEAEKFLQMLEE